MSCAAAVRSESTASAATTSPSLTASSTSIRSRAEDNGTNFSNNIAVHDNYIAMNRAAGDAAIRLANAVFHAQVRHARIHHNELTVYGDAACTRGIYVDGTAAKAIIEGNVSTFFTTNDIWSGAAPDSIIRGDACLSTAPTNNISSGSTPILRADNIGTVFREQTNAARDEVVDAASVCIDASQGEGLRTLPKPWTTGSGYGTRCGIRP